MSNDNITNPKDRSEDDLVRSFFRRGGSPVNFSDDDEDDYYESSLTKTCFDGDMALGLGMIPAEEYSRLYVESNGLLRSKELLGKGKSLKGKRVIRLRGGGRIIPPSWTEQSGSPYDALAESFQAEQTRP